MHEYPRIYLGSVSASARRDLPYFANNTGTVIAGGASGVLNWASNGNRRAWGRIDGSYYDYYELEVIDSTHIRVFSVDRLGELTQADVVVAAAGTYTTLVPGVSIPLHTSLTTGHKARIYPGIFLLDDNTFYIPRGSGSDPVKLAINNPGDVDYIRAYCVAWRGAFHDNTSGSPLAAVLATAPNAIADTYAVTVANGTSSGKKFTFTGTYNTYVVDNVAAASANNVIGGSGLVFTAGAAPANTDTATVEVSDLADAMEFAPDSGGPGTWVPWDPVVGVKVPLNRPGYSDLRVPGSQTIYIWVRLNADITFNIGRGGARLQVDYARAA